MKNLGRMISAERRAFWYQKNDEEMSNFIEKNQKELLESLEGVAAEVDCEPRRCLFILPDSEKDPSNESLMTKLIGRLQKG